MSAKSKETKALQRHESHWFDEMDRSFEQMMRRGLLQPFRDIWPDWAPFQPDLDVRMPRVDMIDREAELLVRAELPGIDKEHVHIEVAGDMLTIRGERAHEEKREEENVYRAEILRGAFSRTLRLPPGLDTDAAEATFEKGLLEIHLPKPEESKRQRIAIS
ncbi:MAG: Hsp20 family protein [Gammaproteobacteria bacterium]|jgi:HSP20 family protein|nr:Hsp20 family protein [Gammaproteobacteria bacterium]